MCPSRLQSVEGRTFESHSAAPDAQKSLHSPYSLDLERLALLEGKSALDNHERLEYSDDDAVWKRLSDRLGVAGLQATSVGGGAGRGSVLKALQDAMGSTCGPGEPLAETIARRLEAVAADPEVSFSGVRMHSLPNWKRLPFEGDQDWSALATYVRESDILEHGADWLILAVAALALGRNILVYSLTYDVAVRFATEDTLSDHYEPSAHLPPGADWIKLAVLDGQAFVPLEPIPPRAHGLLVKLNTMADQMHAKLSGLTELKPATILLGLTGVGKSTMVHVLSGYQM